MQNNTQIYEQLILPFGEDVSMSLQEDFPASRSVLQGKERERKTTATYGRKCLEQFGKFTHVGYWAKMFSELLVGRMGWYSSRCVLTWKLKGTKYNRLYFQLAVSMLPTKGTGYGLLPTVQTQGLKICNEKGETVFMPLGLLPTPTVMEDRRKPNGDTARQKKLMSNLNPFSIQELLPTPTAIDSGSGRINKSPSPGAKERPTIALAAKMGLLPTPNAAESEKYTTKYSPNSQMDKGLTAMEMNNMLPTPTASCHKAGTIANRKDGTSRESELNHLIARHVGQTSQLNPLFVAEMMGFPPDWTVLPFQNGEMKV